MNKKLMLLLTFMTSFIVSIGSVKAEDDLGSSTKCRELTCVYDNKANGNVLYSQWYWKKTVFIQKSDCSYIVKYDSKDIKNPEIKINEPLGGKFYTSTKKIINCPPCAITRRKKKIEFSDLEQNSLYCSDTYISLTESQSTKNFFSDTSSNTGNNDSAGNNSSSNNSNNQGSSNSNNTGNNQNNDNSTSATQNQTNTATNELNCWYKITSTYNTETYMMQQDNDGNRKYFYLSSDNNLNEKKARKEDLFNTKTYDSGSDILTGCPKCMKFDIKGATNNSVVVTAGDSTSSTNGDANGFSCPSGYSKSISEPNTSGTGTTVNDELKCEEKWNVVCKYGYNKNHSETLILKFNDSEFSLERTGRFVPDKIDSSNISIDKITSIRNGKCPQNIYSFEPSNNNGQSSSEEFYLAGDQPSKADKVYTQVSYKDCKNVGNEITVYVVNNCRDLFGEEVIEIINTVMKYIGIIVPILLLVYGVSDFFMAIFSDDQEKIVEKRKMFFKRLIAAVIVFLVPTFVKLVLKISNSVWSDIHADTCVNEDYE